MLQINTGKLFTRGVGFTNRLRGVLYSNVQLRGEDPIITAAGSLISTNALRDRRTLIFEMDERIEEGPTGPGALVSHGVDPFLIDFSAVASFGLNAIVSPDPAVVERLLSSQPSLAAYAPPKKFIKPCFEDQVWLQQDEIQAFVTFVDDLLALERRTFLAVMRAIRTYVAGLYRLEDDLGVAYTLMVSAIESLAQGFDSYHTVWADIDERKRRPVDAALKGASESTITGVRNAIISNEHAAIGRRYRGFVREHIGPDYFRIAPPGGGASMASFELDEALRQAYSLRSLYLHNLRTLPDELTRPFHHEELIYVDRSATLTFHGLARLTRHVIHAFVARGKRVDREPYDYHGEESGIQFMELAPQHWVGTPFLDSKGARKRFEGFLSQLAGCMAKAPNAVLTDLRPMLDDVERLMPGASVQQQQAMLALHYLFNISVGEHQRSPTYPEFILRYEAIVAKPSLESLVTLTIADKLSVWDIETHQNLLDRYFAKRPTPKGLHAPRVFEIAICLALAERYRQAGTIDKMKAQIDRALEIGTQSPQLFNLEKSADVSTPIDWHSIIFPLPDDHRPAS